MAAAPVQPPAETPAIEIAKLKSSALTFRRSH